MWGVKVAGVVCLVLGTASLLAGLALGIRIQAPASARAVAETTPRATPSLVAAPAPTPTPLPAAPEPTPTPTPTPLSFAELQSEVQTLLQTDGVEGSVSLIELSGDRATWSLNGDEPFVAASTYKLPLLMEEAQDVAGGRASADDMLCYEPEDWEDGWFSDYTPGACFTRGELERRVGEYSDNTAAHILVRVDGGSDALNEYARAHGATESAFWDPNATTSSDLARLWQDEAAGHAGGAAAQRYLYPLLTNTEYEDGIPAGVPAGTTVVHKIGILDGEVNDAGLVVNGPRGPYVLSVCTEGGGWTVVASVARAVARFEAS